jgi:hypothetical protein
MFDRKPAEQVEKKIPKVLRPPATAASVEQSDH